MGRDYSTPYYNKRNYNIFMKTTAQLEKEYLPLAERIVGNLISRFDDSDPDNRYITLSEFWGEMEGTVRFSYESINAFHAMACRVAVERGYVLVSLPVVDSEKMAQKSLLDANIYFKDFVYRVTPIDAPELELNGDIYRGKESAHSKLGVYMKPGRKDVEQHDLSHGDFRTVPTHHWFGR